MNAPRIALLVDTATGWGRRLVQGVLDYTMQYGPWDLWIEPKGQKERFDASEQSNLAGIIARVSTPELATTLNQLNAPTINVSALEVQGSHFPRVTTDGHVAAKLAVDHFRDRALRNFAYVGDMQDACVRQHEKAFEKLLAETGSPCHVFEPKTKFGSTLSWSQRDTYLIPWLLSLPKPIGIFTWGFQIGRDIVSACRVADNRNKMTQGLDYEC